MKNNRVQIEPFIDDKTEEIIPKTEEIKPKKFEVQDRPLKNQKAQKTQQVITSKIKAE